MSDDVTGSLSIIAMMHLIYRQLNYMAFAAFYVIIGRKKCRYKCIVSGFKEMLTKCIGRQELMKLWTWQGKGFSFANCMKEKSCRVKKKQSFQ